MIATIAAEWKKCPEGPGSSNDALHSGIFFIVTIAYNLSVWGVVSIWSQLSLRSPKRCYFHMMATIADLFYQRVRTSDFMEPALKNPGNKCKVNDLSIISLAGGLVRHACSVQRSIKWVKAHSVIIDNKKESEQCRVATLTILCIIIALSVTMFIIYLCAKVMNW